jgi:CelD/BcsL family acetyltransferase involved in cellulose biosynthesis
MRINVVHPMELGPCEVESWHRMQRATPSFWHPFLSPEFASAVGRHRPQSRVAVLMDGHDAIGFFPFEKRRLAVGVPISGWLSACQGVIHGPGAQWNACDLLRGCGLSAWRFDNLIADQLPFKAYHAATAPSPVIDLTEGFASYYAKLRARAPDMCRELERKTRKLGREAGELRLVCDSSDPEVLRLLMAWKSEQYRRTNTVDRFEQSWITGLLEDLLATRTDHLSGLLSVLYADDEPVSIQFGLRADNLLIGWFAGYNIEFGKYSPGLMQIRLMAEALGTVGVTKLHMGKGAKGYTYALKNCDTCVSEGIATDRSLPGAAYRLRNSANLYAVHTVRKHRGLRQAADLVLRASGASSHIYGRILPRAFKDRLRGSPARHRGLVPSQRPLVADLPRPNPLGV